MTTVSELNNKSEDKISCVKNDIITFTFQISGAENILITMEGIINPQ